MEGTQEIPTTYSWEIMLIVENNPSNQFAFS
ncbi:UNVERIFIED_CONTAM: hypothetical protein GTU68_062538 [Idotea baltica]|nr:hypothetical protein [Idotea baltica]